MCFPVKLHFPVSCKVVRVSPCRVGVEVADGDAGSVDVERKASGESRRAAVIYPLDPEAVRGAGRDAAVPGFREAKIMGPELEEVRGSPQRVAPRGVTPHSYLREPASRPAPDHDPARRGVVVARADAA